MNKNILWVGCIFFLIAGVIFSWIGKTFDDDIARLYSAIFTAPSILLGFIALSLEK